MPAIRRGRARAGKSLEGFEIVAAVPAALTVDRAPGAALFSSELTRYLALPFYRAMLEQSGFGAGDRRLRPRARARRGPRPPRGGLGAIGDYRAIADFIAAHREAGVTLPAVRPIAFPDAPHYLPTIEAASAC